MRARSELVDLIPARLLDSAATKLAWLNGIEVPAPGVAVAAPLRMQCRHPREGAPQRHASVHETLAETVEQRIGGSATNSFTHYPRVQFDDLPFERAVEAQRARRNSRQT